MLWETFKAARDLGRLHDIVIALIKFGFGDLVQRLGLGTTLERTGKVLNWKEVHDYARLDTPERMRRLMEEMGPTYVKLGQILATRVDLFTPEWIREFEKLQDQVPPVPFESLRSQLLEDLGAAPEELFPYLNQNALAAGSIAQVHRARLESGEEVVLKIRRPGIRPVIEADLRVLARVAQLVQDQISELRPYHPVDVVRQFTISLRRELDLAHECRNAERIARNLRDNSDIVVPAIYWQFTCERVNVQQYIEGVAGRDMDAVVQAGLDRKLLAERGARAVLQMIVQDGLFHADPHPGNALYLAENRLAFIDFGMVGRLTEERREQVGDLLHGLLERDNATVVNVLLLWAGDIPVNAEHLAVEVDGFLDNYHGVALKQLRFSTMLGDITTIMRDHHLTMPPDLTLLFKAFISLEGLGRQLDPDFEVVTLAQPYVRQAIMARYAPEALMRRGWRGLSDMLRLFGDLPRDLRRLMLAMRKGALQINVDVAELKEFIQKMDQSASRITVGLVTSALIIGSSIVMTVSGGPTIFGLPVVGFFGFTAAGIGGVWLLFSIWRSGRRG